jgi:hypothetical protein
MFNLDNIINSPIIKEPWDHKIIDDILDAETFAKAKDMAKELVKVSDFERSEIMWMSDITDIAGANTAITNITESADQLIKNFPQVSGSFKNVQRSKLGYFNNPRFGVSMTESFGEIHDEGTNKIMALIIYLEPEESIGTLLYKENNLSSTPTVVEWKPNRGILFFSQPGVTWHKFDSGNKPRVTLNFYYEKLEALTHLVTNNSTERMCWLYEQFGQDKLMVNI